MQRWKLNRRGPRPICTPMCKYQGWWPWDSRILGGEKTSYPPKSPALTDRKRSNFIWMRNHSSLRSHIIWGWEMLTDKQITKWQSELSLLCTRAMAGNPHDQFTQPGKRIQREGRTTIHHVPSSITCSLKLSLVPIPWNHEKARTEQKPKKRKGLGQRFGATMKVMGLEVF